MAIYLKDLLSAAKNLLYKAASKGLCPTILSYIGFAYMAVPANIQLSIRHLLPLELRKHMLMVLNTDEWTIVLFLITACSAIWGGLGSHIAINLVAKENKELLEENESLKDISESKSIDCYMLFSNYLYSYFKRFNLSSTERVSLYKLEMEMFSCIGRYSDNEVFKSKPNRLYPKDQGCIAKAWEIGEFQEASAPDPENAIEAWKEFNIKRFNFTEDQVNNIRMRSRAYYGIRLQNPQNITVAVLVFESLRQDGLRFEEIQNYFTQHEKRNIVQLLESLESHIPSLEIARREGF